MKAVTHKLNTVLAGGRGGSSALCSCLCETFMPQAILPLIDIPNLAAVCAAALVIDCYLEWKHVPKRDWLLTAVLAVLTFWLLPWAAGLTAGIGEAPENGRSLPAHCSPSWPSFSTR